MDGLNVWCSHSCEQRSKNEEFPSSARKGKWKERARMARSEAKVGSDGNPEGVKGRWR